MKVLNLNHNNTDKQILDYVRQALPKLETEAGLNSAINKVISIEEITQALSSLKNNKAAGPDLITKEMIKKCGKTLSYFTSKNV